MKRMFNVPLVFLLVAASIGLLLRWQLVSPFSGINFTYFLHAHSHVMFLGWVANVLLLAFAWRLIPDERRWPFLAAFWTLQVLLLGMLISFPLQGYGTYSIVFSTLHTLVVFVYIALFFRTIRYLKHASCWFAAVSLIFFVVSSAGPFSLGYIMANGLGKTNWYYFSVYYYLHFQYNGFFTLGIFSLFFRLLEERGVDFDTSAAIRIGKWLAFSCVPAYALSVLWADPGWMFNAVGFAAAVAQLYGLFLLLRLLWSLFARLEGKVTPTSRTYLLIALAAFGLKLVLQAASAHPALASVAYEFRPLVIAYLHLVLAGIISLFLIVWYIEMGLLRIRIARPMLLVFVAGLVGSELCLALQPWWYVLFSDSPISPAWAILIFSAVMLIALTGLLIGAWERRQPGVSPTR